MDLEKWIYGGGSAVLVVVVGKWLVPFLMRVLDNSMASVTASGSALATITAERDQWKQRAIELDGQLQEMRKEWAAMKGDIQLLKYQLHEAQVRIARLTGEPMPIRVDEGGEYGKDD